MPALPERQEAYCTVSLQGITVSTEDELTGMQLLLSDGYLPGNQRV